MENSQIDNRFFHFAQNFNSQVIDEWIDQNKVETNGALVLFGGEKRKSNKFRTVLNNRTGFRCCFQTLFWRVKKWKKRVCSVPRKMHKAEVQLQKNAKILNSLDFSTVVIRDKNNSSDAFYRNLRIVRK